MMLKRLFSRKADAEPVADNWPQVPLGTRVYAIGDVHGRLDLLDALLERIADESARDRAECVHLVMLGDLIDRGPQSAQVVERLLTVPKGVDEMHLLMGNHEEALLEILDGAHSQLPGWIRYGGEQALQSYGLEDTSIFGDREALVAKIHAGIPASHVRLFRSMVDYVQIGDYLFVHAGIFPGRPLEQQAAHDLRWIRDEFLDDNRDHGVMVVHGHTITPDVDCRVNRIGIDTGAYRSGMLTALVIEGSSRRFLKTGQGIAA